MNEFALSLIYSIKKILNKEKIIIVYESNLRN